MGLRSLRCSLFVLLVLLLSGCLVGPLAAQENPYFVTYDHYLEEPGNLEMEYFSTFGTQRDGNNFHSYWTEFEYGATAWWAMTWKRIFWSRTLKRGASTNARSN